jgi:ABC-2 type transport system ATP-binding protein
LQASVGGDSITIETEDAANLAAAISQEFGLAARELEGTIRLEVPDGHRWIARLVEAFPGRIRAIRLGKPTLEDVFIARTGHRFARERRDS